MSSSLIFVITYILKPKLWLENLTFMLVIITLHITFRFGPGGFDLKVIHSGGNNSCFEKTSLSFCLSPRHYGFKRI